MYDMGWILDLLSSHLGGDMVDKKNTQKKGSGTSSTGARTIKKTKKGKK